LANKKTATAAAGRAINAPGQSGVLTAALALRGKSVRLAPNTMGGHTMFIKLTCTDRVATAVNAAQITFISQVQDGTRIRFGEGRSVTVVEPLDEIMDRLNQTPAFA
jgi:hypothetical protein